VTRYTLQSRREMICRLWLERSKVKVYKTASEMEKIDRGQMFYPLKNMN